jgi:hypothetical protein
LTLRSLSPPCRASQVIAPLNRVRYLVTPRALPAIVEMSARLDSSLKVRVCAGVCGVCG